MWNLSPIVAGLLVATAIGLLIGVEREKHRAEQPGKDAAGVRTFTLVAIASAIAAIIGSTWVMALAVASTMGLALVSYRQTSGGDPGLTTEVALVVTSLLGLLAMAEPRLAAGIGTGVAILLASRSRLHRFIRERLTRAEISDALLLAGAALVVLPLLPDQAVDPYGVVNPRIIWTLAVVVMAINGAGYLALRALGTGRGLPLAGLFSGFVSSTATHAAMGSRATQQPALLMSSVAGASLSSVATTVQLLIVVGLADRALLGVLWPGMLLAGLVAAGYGAWFLWQSRLAPRDGEVLPGRPFEPAHALVFAVTVTAALFISAALEASLGVAGGVAGIAVAGLADTHSAAASAAALHRGEKLTLEIAAIAALLAFSTNATVKLLASFATGGAAFLWRIVPGQVLGVAAAWLGWLLFGR